MESSCKRYVVRTLFEKTDTQKGEFETLEQARTCADEFAVYGYQVYDETGAVAYTTYTPLVASLLREAKAVTDYVRETHFSYGNAPLNPAMDHTAKLISCDRLVSWTLYRIGYTDQPRRGGLVLMEWGHARHFQDWCVAHGFQLIEKKAELQPGDIVFVKPRPWDPQMMYASHTFLYAGKAEGELAYRYDCGSDVRIQSVQPSCETVDEFMYAYRPVPVEEGLAAAKAANRPVLDE